MSPFENNQDLFTAHQIAAALNVSRQHVFKVLKAVPQTGSVLKGGRPVGGWAFSDLPADLRARLDTEAARLGFRSAESLLDRGRTPWQPEIPISEAAQHHVQKAARLQKALLPVLQELKDIESMASVEERGLRLYQEVFGHKITARHWRRLMMRTFNRDRGNDDFLRLELYLDDKLQRSCKPPAGRSKTAAGGFEDVRAAIALIADPARPAAKEKEVIWAKTLSAVEDLMRGGMAGKAAGKAALDFLSGEALFMAKSPKALRAAFYRKLKAFRDADGHLGIVADRRRERSGNRRAPVISKEDRMNILTYAVRAGGRLSQGWREAWRDKALSPELMQHYSLNERQNKSYVPASIRDALSHEVRMVEDWHHGPHRAKMNGAFLERDPGSACSGDWFQGDDTTAPVYFHNERDPRHPTRGQLLLMVDVRSLMILAFVLIADKSYNGRDVRNLITKTADRWGLPRKGYYFERGSWESKVVKGGISWAETEHGITTGLNRRFIHAREARAKVVERVFGMFQNYCERVHGYVGRDERHDCYERMQKNLQAVRSGKVPGAEALLTQEELCDVFAEIVDRYNNDPQNGKYLNGLTPEEAFLKNFGSPMVKLDRTTRYLLADSVEKVRIGRNGISLVRGKERFTYKNEQTGRMKGMEVLAWFNPESPEILCVTDLKKKNLFAVERAQAVPMMDADPDLLAQEMARNEAHNAYSKRLYREVKQRFPDEIRERLFAPTVADEQSAALGLEIEYSREQAEKKQKKQAKQKQAISCAGVRPSPIAERRERQAEAAPRLRRMLEELGMAGER